MKVWNPSHWTAKEFPGETFKLRLLGKEGLGKEWEGTASQTEKYMLKYFGGKECGAFTEWSSQ